MQFPNPYPSPPPPKKKKLDNLVLENWLFKTTKQTRVHFSIFPKTILCIAWSHIYFDKYSLQTHRRTGIFEINQ